MGFWSLILVRRVDRGYSTRQLSDTWLAFKDMDVRYCLKCQSRCLRYLNEGVVRIISQVGIGLL